MEPNVFLGYFERGIACVLSNFEHEQYPFDTLDQNNLAHGVYSVAQWKYWDPSRFWYGYALPFHVSKYMLWNLMYFWNTLKGIVVWPNEGIAFF
jgi:hypothetical protein